MELAVHSLSWGSFQLWAWMVVSGGLPAGAAERQVREAPGRTDAVTLRIWLHEGHDDDPGVVALGLDFLGFSTWAESESEVVTKVPNKFTEYSAWRSRHGLPVVAPGAKLEIVGHLVGNEILFPPDLEPATVEEIDLTINLLGCSRADLIAELEAAPEAVLDWDPPYKRFAPWASWRSVRANLAHIANGETHYYTKNIGHQPALPPVEPSADWKTFLPQRRAEAVAFLETLKSSRDLCRARTVNHGFGDESWSVRKALRRLVSHEIVHTKSIARVVRDYRALRQGRLTTRSS